MPPDIRHVVFLMQENQSFDRMLGWLPPPHDVARPGARLAIVPRPDQDWLGPSFEVTWGPGAVRRTMFATPHFPGTWLRKGFWPNAPRGLPYDQSEARQPQVVAEKMTRSSVARAFRAEERQAARVTELARAIVTQSFVHLSATDVPVYDFLARNFVVCNRWFATEGSFTWPNRMALAQDRRWAFGDPRAAGLKGVLGAAGIELEMLGWGYGASVMRWLSPTFAGYTGAFGADSWRDQLDRVFDRWDHESDRPHFLWVESTHSATGTRRLCNDHRYASVLDGQAFVRDIYQSLRAHPSIWEHCLFVVTYDEHGGWYDHVIPPRAPWARTGSERWRDRLGGRVPTFLVSPWVRAGALHDTLDHTSLLAWLALTFPPAAGRPRPALGLSGHHHGDPFANAWVGAPRDIPAAPPDPWTGFDPRVEGSLALAYARYLGPHGRPDWFDASAAEEQDPDALSAQVAATVEGVVVVPDPEEA
ncbi:MAG: alkaline phosphatase family protein [Myxococcota bacterium]